MKTKVFCIGDLKTATTSMGRALEVLGYKHTGYSPELTEEVQRGNLQVALDHAKDYEAFDDWPWGLASVYRDLDRTFPGSKFIYTDRNLIPWANSWLKYFYANPDWPFGDEATFEQDFHERIAIKYRRKRDVLEYFKDRPDDLLIMNIPAGDGWEKVCAFLDLPVPDEGFPHENKRR